MFAAGPPPGREGLPEAFKGKSRALNLDRLGLDQVPPYVYGLGYLEGLSARGNRLAHLAPEIGLLRGLRRLDLEGNVIRRLPLELCLCTALEELGLALNAWEEPPPEVRGGGCEVVLRYLRAQYLAPTVCTLVLPREGRGEGGGRFIVLVRVTRKSPGCRRRSS